MPSHARPNRLYVVTVGLNAEKITNLLRGLGLAAGDYVLAVNSIPRVEGAVEAMRRVRVFVENSGGVYSEKWLDPRPTLPSETTSSRFRKNVALIRSIVEEAAPREAAVFTVSGGFRVIGYVVEHAAMALATSWKIFRDVAESSPDIMDRCGGGFTPPQRIEFKVEIEDDPRTTEYLREAFPSLRDRLIEVTPVSPLADLRPAQATSLTPGRLYILALAATREYLRPGTLLPARAEKKPFTPLHRKQDLANAIWSLLYSKEADPAARPYTQQCLRALWSPKNTQYSHRSLAETVRRLTYYAERLGLLELHPLKPTDLAIALTATRDDLARILSHAAEQQQTQ